MDEDAKAMEEMIFSIMADMEPIGFNNIEEFRNMGSMD
jgi:hypothetical protein